MNIPRDDLVFALRSLGKRPGFAGAIIGALALGVGAGIAVFSVIDAAVLRPLAFPDPDQLLVLSMVSREPGSSGGRVSVLDFLDWKEQSRSFAQLAVASEEAFVLTGVDYPERIQAARVSADFFALFGVQPIRGGIPAGAWSADQPGAVLSHRMWRTRFGGDEGIAGRPLTLDDQPHTVLAVMPPELDFPKAADVWLPFDLKAGASARGARILTALGRLREEVTLKEARIEMEMIASQLAAAYPETNDGMGVALTPLHERLVGGADTVLAILLAAVGFVLLIVCANVASLLLARATARTQEMQIRAALGATRRRLVFLLLTESLLLAVAGGALGLPLGLAGSRLFVALYPDPIHGTDQLGLDWMVLGFDLLLVLGTALLCGLIPAFQGTKRALAGSLREGAMHLTASAGTRRTQATVLVLQIAVTLVLLFGAGLMLNSLFRLLRVDPGFRPDRLLTARVVLPKSRYPEAPQRVAFFDALLARLNANPRVDSAAGVTNLPLSGTNMLFGFELENRPAAGRDEPLLANYRAVSSGYVDTGDRRWLELSYRFEHRAVLDPLKRHQDRLAGLHGNTQVPKLLGSIARFAAAGDPGDGFAAAFFWDRVVGHHTYATGGHGKDEYFGEADKLSDRVDGRTAESCNVYNMLKLTRKLFALRPDAHYAEFHERALFNHVLAAIDPEDGRTCYMVPVGRGVKREYQDMARSFTCCLGTGMETHALHGDGIYYESGDRLWVNLYVPSTARWAAAGVDLAVETEFPEGETATLALTLSSPRRFTLALRRPRWAEEGFSVAVNGAALAQLPPPESYVELTRSWRTGDVVEVKLPKTLRLEPVPDNPRRAAILWGPLVLAGDLGAEGFPVWELGAVPALVAAERPVAEWLEPVPGKPGAFRSQGVGRDTDVEFEPFYRLHHRTYAIYWDLYTPQEWERKSAEYAAERERQRQLARATVAFVQPGESESERDFHPRGEDTRPDRAKGRPCRRGKKWFSFDLPVDPIGPLALVVTYYQDEWRQRTFAILVEGRKIGEQVIERGGVPHFFDVEYAVPEVLIRDKKTVSVRFEATQGNEIACVYGVRMIRAGLESENR